MTVKLNTEALNRNGYRILSAGVDFRAFRQNPVLLLQHDDYSSQVLPIGKVNNLRVEGKDLLGDLEFDAEDELAMKVKGKFDRGYLHAVSMSHQPFETSEDPALLLKGQRRSTVTKTELLELSVVKVPGNGGAVRLAHGEQALDKEVPLLPPHLLSNHSGGEAHGQITEPSKMKDIALKLGLPADATESQIVTAIGTLQTQLASNADQRAEDLVTQALSAGKITEAEKPVYLKLAKGDYASTAELLGARKGTEVKPEDKAPEVQLKDVLAAIKGQASSGPETDAAKFLRLSKEDPSELARLRDAEPDTYKRLALAYTKSI